jgi:HlyD family secretion protein
MNAVPTSPATALQAPPVPPPESSPRRSSRSLWKPTGAFLGLGGILVAGWLAWPKGAVADVLSAPVIRGDMPVTVIERGELDSTNSVIVRCDVEGERIKLVSIVPEGTRVSKNEEVCRFDTDELQKQYELQNIKWQTAEIKVKSARGDLAVQRNKERSEIDKATLAHKLAEIDLEKYKNREFDSLLEEQQMNLGLARKELKEAEDNLEFTRNLVKKGFLPLEQVRVQELMVEKTKSQVRAGASKLGMLQEYERKRKIAELEGKAKETREELARTKDSQKAATEKAVSDLDGAEVNARLEKATLDRNKAQIDRCIIKAPQDGIVVYFKRYYDEAARIQPGASLFYQQPIFTLPDLSKMKVKVKIHESVIKKITKGQKATLQADALPNRPMTGTVKSVGTLAQSEGWRQTVKEYLVEIEIDDLPTDGGLKPGMTAETKIHVQIVPNALMVPVQAVTEFEGKPVCYVRKGRGLERRTVEVGESNDQFIQVVDGVEEGEQVALDARSRAAAEVKAAKQ